VLFCLLFGISDEFHQAFIPGRVVSAWDVAADSFGALLVVCLWYRQTGKSVTNCS
jgi:VanZ family protein